MHGEIATYERIYFMIGIVYSSKTGNTQSLANSLNFMESKYCVSVMKQYLSTLRNQNVFLFGTAGFGKSKEYFEMILKNVQSHLDASNCVKGTWMCQGKMPLAIRAKFESNPEMLKNFDEALKHPNDKDVDSLMKSVNEAL